MTALTLKTARVRAMLLALCMASPLLAAAADPNSESPGLPGLLTIEAQDLRAVHGSSAGGRIEAGWLRVSFARDTLVADPQWTRTFPDGGTFSFAASHRTAFECYDLLTAVPKYRSPGSARAVRVVVSGRGYVSSEGGAGMQLHLAGVSNCEAEVRRTDLKPASLDERAGPKLEVIAGGIQGVYGNSSGASVHADWIWVGTTPYQEEHRNTWFRFRSLEAMDYECYSIIAATSLRHPEDVRQGPRIFIEGEGSPGTRPYFAPKFKKLSACTVLVY